MHTRNKTKPLETTKETKPTRKQPFIPGKKPNNSRVFLFLLSIMAKNTRRMHTRKELKIHIHPYKKNSKTKHVDRTRCYWLYWCPYYHHSLTQALCRSPSRSLLHQWDCMWEREIVGGGVGSRACPHCPDLWGHLHGQMPAQDASSLSPACCRQQSRKPPSPN